ncbi:FAD-dependent pyridine nucleotide-disulfide oxidoreductase (macronuclear) [Tetrahymena thermophila SB210]|uniref:Sulfide:quinone oxidoreductase, mitochondrial n=1 Tax=Tetrahymena thermophila (strain SB210) TaxID=312017 RepID=Q24JG1_TETTS|nr:FAD-dependent pyridine nucleotide-disulfide oxidoreductase [Tetrahymena thermophila SB210]EAS07915.1 FAD-dependent pyridine nucleotide-disulfide oxidoreductase [Tetrahymena thermophila SB210]|eukprot:XP_001028157.1 FAD-dependent pyridine nucleotide-disulfide oxidoreductase [Tetrahymena thermophila SB210]
MLNRIFKYQFATATHTPLCIIGGGTASLNVTAQLSHRKGINLSHIRVFDPSRFHYYQPSWTMVGGGLYDAEKSYRTQQSLFNKKINFNFNAVTKVIPEQNKFITDDGREWTYDHLIISTGIKVDFKGIKGLKEALDDPNCPVGSIYWKDYATKFNQFAKEFKGGKAVFTEPQMPIKCGGAPQKVLYLNEERFRRNGVRNQTSIEFHKTIPVVFGVPKYSASLAEIIKQKNIDLHLKSKLVEVRGQDRVAVFENQDNKVLTEVKFDLLHAVPPQTAPKFIAESGLGDASGFVDVDKQTLLHKKYKNVWAIGDSSNLPTSKTAAAVMSQTPILVDNLLHIWKQKNSEASLPQKYEGYTSCPIFTGDKKLILAEFKYDSVVDETFYRHQDKPHRLFYHLKKDFFPFAYWNLMARGIWYGREGILPHFLKTITNTF